MLPHLAVGRGQAVAALAAKQRTSGSSGLARHLRCMHRAKIHLAGIVVQSHGILR